MNGNSIGNNGSTSHGASKIYASDWFRSWGDTGIYNESYGGGLYMTDSSWIRTYGGKNFYCDAELRVHGRLSSNTARIRGSYGAISIGGNGIAGGWDGIEFESPQTFMVSTTDAESGMYRNNSSFNWVWYYGTLYTFSDERYKREIEPMSFGLSFVKALQPVSFLRLTEAPDDDPEATEEGYCYGFTAQNVRAALDLVGETRDVRIHDIGGPDMGLIACTENAVYDRQYIGITEFISPIVKSLQEINNRIKVLQEAQ